MQGTFTPYDAIKNLLQNWWKIAVLAIIFGLLGLGFSYLHPPKYKAEAIFSATIDYREINFDNLYDGNGDPLTFTQYDEDMALSVVQRVLIEVRQKAIDYAQTLDPTLDAATFIENSKIERLHAMWHLQYRHENPQTAQSIVNYWAEEGITQLKIEQAAGTVEPYVIVDLIFPAVLPQTPLYQDRNTLVLTGTMIGFVLGILAVDMKYRFFTKSEKA